MNSWFSRSLALLCAAAVTFSVATAQKAQSLVYKFAPGKTYQYKSVSDGTVIQEMAGQEMKIENGSNITVSLTTEKIGSDGSITLITAIVEGSNRIKNPMQDTTIALTDMVGKRMRLQVKNDGTVMGREIVDTVASEGQMRGAGQREAVRLHILPGKSVKAGDTWTSTFVDTVDGMGGKIVNVIKSNYTLVGTEDRSGVSCLKVGYDGAITVEGTGNMQGMDLYIEGGGKVNGTMYFDAARGMVVYDESTTETESTIAVTGQQNMTIPISQKSKTVQTLLP
jgi:Family of unknown function (DUF6263)